MAATYGSHHPLVTLDCCSQTYDFADLSYSLELVPGKLGPALTI